MIEPFIALFFRPSRSQRFESVAFVHKLGVILEAACSSSDPSANGSNDESPTRDEEASITISLLLLLEQYLRSGLVEPQVYDRAISPALAGLVQSPESAVATKSKKICLIIKALSSG